MGNECKKSNSGLFTFFALAGFVGALILIKNLKPRESKDSAEEKVVEKTYSKKTPLLQKPEKVTEISKKEYKLNPRQRNILDVVALKGSISPKDLQKLVPDVSTRTLRRDMDVLVSLKLVSQEGSTKSTYYKYIGK